MKKLINKTATAGAVGLLITGAIFGGIASMTSTASADTTSISTAVEAPVANESIDALDADGVNGPQDENGSNCANEANEALDADGVNGPQDENGPDDANEANEALDADGVNGPQDENGPDDANEVCDIAVGNK